MNKIIYILSLLPEKEKNFVRKCIVVVILCLVLVQGLLVYLVSVAVQTPNEFITQVLRLDDDVIKLKLDLEDKLCVLVGNLSDNPENQTNKNKVSIGLGFALYCDNVGVNYRFFFIDEETTAIKAYYSNNYFLLLHRKIPHPPQTV